MRDSRYLCSIDSSKQLIVSTVAAGLALMLSGCAIGGLAGPSKDAETPTAISELHGFAKGGEQAIQGANVYLVLTGNTGYGTGDVIAGTATTSNDANGGFTIAANGTTCTAPQQAYIVISGGSTGGGTNNQNLLVSAIGSCATLATSGLYVDVNEPSTVAAAYALSSFAKTDGTAPYVHIGASANNSNSTGSTTGAAGLPHAFLNALNLVNNYSTSGYPTGQAYTTIPNNPTLATITPPTTMVNALADILQSCVNSTGGFGSTSPSFSTPSTPSSTAGSSASLYLNPTTSAVGGTVDISYGGTPLTGSIPGATSATTFAAQFNAIPAFSGATDIVSFTTPTTPTGTTSSTATVTGINATTSVSGTISISLNGGTPLVDSISGIISPATFASQFNLITDYSSNGIVASATGNTVTITGPVAGTLNFTGSSLTGSGSVLVATVLGNTVIVSGLSGTANTLSFSGTSLTGTGSDGSTCGNLFAVTPNLSGTTPTNTFQAMLNLAKNPYPSATAVTSLYNLIPPQVAFTPYPTTAPVDFTLGFYIQLTTFPKTSAGGATTTSYPYRLALDANDNAYVYDTDVSSATASSIYSFASNLQVNYVSSGAGSVSAETLNARGMALDGLGNLWMGRTTSGTTNVFRFNATTGAFIQTYTTASIQPYAFAVDRANNIWFTGGSSTTNNILELVNTSSSGTGTWASTATVIGQSGTPGTSGSPNPATAQGGGGYGIMVDSFQNVWIADEYGASASGAFGNSTSVVKNVNTVTAPCYTSYTTSCAAVTGSNASISTYQLDGTETISVVYDASYGNLSSGTYPTPATGTYSYNVDVADDANQATASANAFGTAAINELPVSVTVAPGGGITTTVSTGSASGCTGTTFGSPDGDVCITAASTGSPAITYPQMIAMDGAGYLWLSDNTSHTPIVFKGTTLFSEPNGFNPCISTIAVACSTSGNEMGNLRAIAIDSTGSVWIDATSSTTPTKSGVYVLIGAATPAWPLLGMGLQGVEP